MRHTVIGGIVLGVLLTGAEGIAQEPRIGVVNVEKILRDYQKLLAQQALIRKRELEVRSAVAAKNKHYQELQEKRDLFAKGSPEYSKHNREMIQVKNEARSLTEAAEQELRIQASLALANCYNDVVAEVRKYGPEKGYTLILRFNDAKITGTSPDKVSMLIAGRRVLYSAPGLDLTSAILDRLNKAYERQQAGTGSSR